MKISIDIECEPEEARSFFGSPDVAPMQQTLMAELEARLKRGLEAADIETLIKTWLPAGMENWQRLQMMIWSQVAGAGGKGGKT